MAKIGVEARFLAYDLREMQTDRAVASFGSGWLFLCLALAAHVTDEAVTGFLNVYNPTVTELRARYSWFPMPVFGFREWLVGLIGLVIILLLLTPFAMRGSSWMRPLAYFLAVVMILNGLGHTLGTVFGRTVITVHFARPMPGFYSSPLLLAAGFYLLYQLVSFTRCAPPTGAARGPSADHPTNRKLALRGGPAERNRSF